MDNSILFTNDNVYQIYINTNDEFLLELSFITYFLKENPYNYNFFNAEHLWFDSSNLLDDGPIALSELTLCAKNHNELAYEVFSYSEDILGNYFKGHLRNNPVMSRVLSSFVNDTSKDNLKDIIYSLIIKKRKGEPITSQSVIKLTKKLLNIESKDTVLDLCSGNGAFISSISETKNIFGIEINKDYLRNSFILCVISGKEPVLLHHDALTFSGLKFNKIFCEYPWAYIYNRPLQSLGCEEWQPLPVNDLKRSMTSWLFISKALSLLDENGIAVIHCNDGALFSTYESNIRKAAIKSGLIKGVISLPMKINNFTSVKSSLLVLSNGNKEIRFVDATSFGKLNPKTKCKEFSEDDIDRIVSLFLSNTEKGLSETIPLSLIQESYLNVDRYLNPDVAPVRIKKGKRIKDVLASELLKSVVSNSTLLTNEPKTGIRVLSSPDIKNGAFDVNNLPYLSDEGLSSLPKNWEKNILKSGDVVMTNKSTVIKSAVSNIGNETVVLFGSLYGLRVNPIVMKPEYLCSFINSNAGQLLLKTIQTGTIISMITSSNLLELVVPCPSLSEQQKICEDISITLDMIRESNERIAKLQKQYESSFDDLLSEE